MDVGLDLSFLVEYSFHDDIIHSIEVHAKKSEDVIVESISSDKFVGLTPDLNFWSSRGIFLSNFFDSIWHLDECPPSLSKSAYDLHGVLIAFASDVAVLMSLTVFPFRKFDYVAL